MVWDCAMIGQSVINVKSGANSRLSTFSAGVVLIFMIIVLGGLVVQIPMPILAGIMVMVSIGTFDWNSFKYIQKHQNRCSCYDTYSDNCTDDT